MASVENVVKFSSITFSSYASFLRLSLLPQLYLLPDVSLELWEKYPSLTFIHVSATLVFIIFLFASKLLDSGCWFSAESFILLTSMP